MSCQAGLVVILMNYFRCDCLCSHVHDSYVDCAGISDNMAINC